MSEIFEKAKPIWLKAKEREKNIHANFRSILHLDEQKVQIKIATSGIYNLYVNNNFVCYGPARAGRGHFRVDEIEIGDFTHKGENIIVVKAIGYYVNSFYIMKQPSFLQAEITQNGVVMAYTGGDNFHAQQNKYAILKTQRYSFQRPMVEAYHLDAKWNNFSTIADENDLYDDIAIQPECIMIPRRADYPKYEKCKGQGIASGKIRINSDLREINKDRSLTQIGDKLQGFTCEELDFCGTDEVYSMQFEFDETVDLSESIKDSCFKVYEFTHNATGMIKLTVRCNEKVRLYCIFDEVLVNGDISLARLGCANVIRYELEHGEYQLQFAEVYTLKYLKIVVLGDAAEINDVYMVEYKHPPISYTPNVIKGDLELTQIFDAAVESFRQNSVDIFMDCPSRERAGWLCDSFFTSRVEYILTGDSKIEKSFLENFLHENTYEFLPKGMLPMCYPSDHNDENYIANWALWMVLEVEEYIKRSDDFSLAESFKSKFYALIEYFMNYENSDGLLENVEGWVFIEWSKANELVQDVNYPSNMLYSAALRCMAKLYNDDALLVKADKIKTKILEQSYRNGFFTDNAIRDGGILKNTGESTEVCQYYAFFFDIATKESHPQLLDILITDFGPQRTKENDKYPQVYPANAFIGNYMRLDIMMRYGFKREVLENIRGYFLHMAKRTGTLWENMSETASCNHGFASHVIYWLAQFDD